MLSLKLQVLLGYLLQLVFTWEDKWKRYKLTDEQVVTANKILQDFNESELLQTQRSDAMKGIFEGKKQDTSGHARFKDIKWDDEKNERRYKPLCRVLVRQAFPDAKTGKYADGITATRRCSCGFIASQLVLLAAHCLSGPPEPTPHVWNIVTVIPQYGIMGNDTKAHVEHMKKNARVAVEWWMPANFPTGELNNAKTPYSFQDIAFIKIDRPIEGMKNFYTMKVPWVMIGQKGKDYNLVNLKVIALGYPTEYKGGEVAVDFKGQLLLGHYEKQHYFLWLDGKPKRKGNAEVQGDTVKPFGPGASGGPWIANEDSIADIDEDLRESMQMAVFSLQSAHCGIEGCRTNSGPVFTPRIIEVTDLIRDIKEPTAAQVVARTAAGHISVVQFTLKADNGVYEYNKKD